MKRTILGEEIKRTPQKLGNKCKQPTETIQ